MEQGTGIEPAFTAWEAVVLPIYEPCGYHGIIPEENGKCNPFLSTDKGPLPSLSSLPPFQQKTSIPLGWMFFGDPERTRLHFPWGKIMVLPPSSRGQAICRRHIAFYFRVRPFFSKKHPSRWDGCFLATRNGLEPSTSSVTGWRANRLHHRAKWWNATNYSR